MSNYPANISKINIDAVQLDLAILQAVRRFAQSRPWRGTLGERKVKFRNAVERICRAAGATMPRVVFRIDERSDSGRSCYVAGAHIIVLRGRLSVITTLHEIAHLLHGHSEYTACVWSLAYFRACFPKSYAELTFDGHMARAAEG